MNTSCKSKDNFKPAKNLIRPTDSHSSCSMTDKEINLQRFKLKPLIDKVVAILEVGLQELLSDYVDDFNKYEENYEAVLMLPIVQKIAKSLNKQTIVKILQKENIALRKEIKKLEKQNTEEHISLKIIDTDVVCNEVKVEKLYETILVDKNNDDDSDEENSDCKGDGDCDEEDEEEEEKEEEKEEEEKEEEEEEEEEEEKEEEEKEEEEKEEDEKEEEEEEDEKEEEEEEEEKEEDEEEEEEEKEEDEKEEEKEEEEENSEVETEADDENEEVFVIEIYDVDYYTNDEKNGSIYAIDSEDEVGKKVGYFKDEDPVFY